VESIDSLLELLDEPNPQKHMSTSNNHYNSSSNTQHSTSSNTSSYHTSSKGEWNPCVCAHVSSRYWQLCSYRIIVNVIIRFSYI
jgi:hypothetical protein